MYRGEGQACQVISECSLSSCLPPLSPLVPLRVQCVRKIVTSLKVFSY